MKQVEIEPVKMEELETLVRISRQTFTDTFSAHNTPEDMDLFVEKTFRPDILYAELQHPSNYFYFAKIQNEVAGYCKLCTGELAAIGEKDSLEIARIYVVKDQLGHGIGKALMNFALAFAADQRRKSVYLGVWEENQRAIRFYEQFGFQKCGEHVFMVGTDAQTDWIMKKALQTSETG